MDSSVSPKKLFQLQAAFAEGGGICPQHQEKELIELGIMLFVPMFSGLVHLTYFTSMGMLILDSQLTFFFLFMTSFKCPCPLFLEAVSE